MPAMLLIGFWVDDPIDGPPPSRFAHLPALVAEHGHELITVHRTRLAAEPWLSVPPAAIVLSGSRLCLGEDCALTDFPIVEHLLDALPRVPVLGICFGHQYLNHRAGGRLERFGLYRDDHDHPVRHHGHGLFAGLPDPCPLAESHVQRVTVPGDGYRVIAESVDGIEAVAHDHLPRLGVQFHPEYWPRQRAPHGERVLRNWLATVVDRG